MSISSLLRSRGVTLKLYKKTGETSEYGYRRPVYVEASFQAIVGYLTPSKLFFLKEGEYTSSDIWFVCEGEAWDASNNIYQIEVGDEVEYDGKRFLITEVRTISRGYKEFLAKEVKK